MSTSGTFLDALVHALRAAATYNRGDQVPPAAVLWTDQDRRWEALVPLLRDTLPILTLGAYQPPTRTGPAIWLRCMLARMVPDADCPPTSCRSCTCPA